MSSDQRAEARRQVAILKRVDGGRTQMGTLASRLRDEYLRLGRIPRGAPLTFIVHVSSTGRGTIDSIQGDIRPFLKEFVDNPEGYHSRIGVDPPDEFGFWGSECRACNNATHASMICDTCLSEKHTVPLYIGKKPDAQLPEGTTP